MYCASYLDEQKDMYVAVDWACGALVIVHST